MVITWQLSKPGCYRGRRSKLVACCLIVSLILALAKRRRALGEAEKGDVSEIFKERRRWIANVPSRTKSTLRHKTTLEVLIWNNRARSCRRRRRCFWEPTQARELLRPE